MIDKRRKMWMIFDWYWPFKRGDGGRWKTDWTSDGNRSKGIGYFKNNHSLNCGCSMCRAMTSYKRMERKRLRQKRKNQTRKLMKVINGHNELD